QGDVAQQTKTTLAGRVEVVATADGRPTLARVSFSPESAMVITVNGTPKTEPYALAGQTVLVEIRGETIVSVRRGSQPIELAAADLGMLTPFVVFHDDVLPNREVDYGDSWPAELTSQDGQMRTVLTVGVASAGDSNGVVVLSTNGTVTFNHAPVDMTSEGKITGSMTIDTATGLPRTSLAQGTVTSAGTMNQAGQTMTLQSAGAITLNRQLTPGPGGSMGTGPHSGRVSTAPAPAVSSRGDQRLIGIFGGESLAGGDTGVYSNTQLKWVFNADGSVFFGAKAHWYAAERDYNQNLEWTANGESAEDTDRGTWQADGQFLTIQWSNGNVSRYAYGFEPNGALVFRNARTKKLINFYNRLR
ncbi:MAG: hypothetical protein AAGC71_08935, partial [Pseudomonadota bacterium]